MSSFLFSLLSEPVVVLLSIALAFKSVAGSAWLKEKTRVLPGCDFS